MAGFTSKHNSVVFVLWFGSDWLGAKAEHEGKTANYFWHIRPEVEFELRRLLAINA
jgi:hypothetical protein